MAQISRYTGNLNSFGSNSTGTERYVFGSSTIQSDVLNDNINSDFLRGWGTLNPGQKPPEQWFNAVGFTLGQLIAYMHQVGIPTWDNAQEYYINSYTVGSNGLLYKALTGTGGTPNVGNDPTTDTVNWISADKSVPAGFISPFAGTAVPQDYLECNGASLDTTTYADLFAAIGYTWGGAGSNFNLPDYRDYFIRGANTTGGRLVSGTESWAIQNIVGNIRNSIFTDATATGAFTLSDDIDTSGFPGGQNVLKQATFDANLVSQTDTETRPQNKAALICIKY